MPLLFPVDLILHPHFESKVRELLGDSAHEFYWVDETKGTAQQRETYIKGQQHYARDTKSRWDLEVMKEEHAQAALAQQHFLDMCNRM